MKTKILFLLVCFVFIICTIIASIPNLSIIINSTPREGRAIIAVYDKFESTPIQNATVCILETQTYYETSKLGLVTLSFPLSTKNTLNTSPLDAPFQNFTLLIYANGYLPHFYHGIKIEHNITKTGVVINLTPLTTNLNSTYTESYEFPNTAYSENLIKKFRQQ